MTRAPPAGADRLAGLPILIDAIAVLECEIVVEPPVGDHWIVVARVDHLSATPSNDSLVFFASTFGEVR